MGRGGPIDRDLRQVCGEFQPVAPVKVALGPQATVPCPYFVPQGRQ